MTNDLNLHPPTYLKKTDLEPPPKPPQQPTPQFTTSININNGSLPNGNLHTKDSTNGKFFFK